MGGVGRRVVVHSVGRDRERGEREREGKEGGWGERKEEAEKRTS